MTRTILSLACVLALAAACGGDGSGSAPNKVLVFSRTTGFRHASIEPGVEAIRRLGDEHGFAVDHTEDATLFTSENLAQYRAVVFLSTFGVTWPASAPPRSWRSTADGLTIGER